MDFLGGAPKPARIEEIDRFFRECGFLRSSVDVRCPS